jgi:SNF2 family DNA or RNA helicase
LLVESGEKVVLFGWHREVYALWMDRLSDLKPALYTGTESPTQKEQARDRFINGEAPILIMSLRAGAGLDGLQHTCRTVVFGELDWSPGVHEQCVGRIHRDGQPDPVVAYFLIAEHGSDPVIADVLQLKRQQVDGVRDPYASLVERVESLEAGGERVKKLAETYLKQRPGSLRIQDEAS